MSEKKGYFFVCQDEEDESKWNICKNEHDDGQPVVETFDTKEQAEFSAHYHYNRPIREKLVNNLLDELAEAFMVERSRFHLTSFVYSDPTYYVEFKNDAGTEFRFIDIYFNETTMEIMQRCVEVQF